MARSRFTSASLALTIAACAGRFGRAGTGLRLSAPEDVRWESGGAREVVLVIENTGASPVELPPVAPARASVAVFRGGEVSPICREAAADLAPIVPRATLAPGERRQVVVRLDACGAAAAGEYRFEAWYDVGSASGRRGDAQRLGPEQGRIVIRPPANAVRLPASRAAVTPPEHAETPGRPGRGAPGAARAPPPPLGAASAACVDDALERRGLNAFGDPAGRTYPEGPPALDDFERQEMVLERHPDIATLCGVVP